MNRISQSTLISPMNSELINNESSKRICNHMNKDHPDAVKAYAKYYGGIENFESARMVNLSPESIELKVDEQYLQIKFDHILKDCADAHKTLVNMIKSIPKT